MGLAGWVGGKQFPTEDQELSIWKGLLLRGQGEEREVVVKKIGRKPGMLGILRKHWFLERERKETVFRTRSDQGKRKWEQGH